jgi:hypothetical protein
MWCRPLTNYRLPPNIRPFECLNGGWNGRWDSEKDLMFILGGHDNDPGTPAIKVWEGHVPSHYTDYNAAIRWIEEQIK